MLYARTAADYDLALDTLKSVDDSQYAYWMKNWHNIRHMFSFYRTKDNFNLGDFTNNRIESFQRWRKTYLRSMRNLGPVINRLVKYECYDKPDDAWRLEFLTLILFLNYYFVLDA